MKQFPTFIIIASLIAAFFLSGVINKTFSESIFGNVADWTMVIVTIGTAYFLYETLQSQKDVQRDQEKVNKLEVIKIRKEIKPNLAFEELTGNEISYSFKIFIRNNPIHKLKISSANFFTIASHDVPRSEDDRFSYSISRLPNDNTPIELIDMSYSLQDLIVIDNIINTFEISFQDEFEFNYAKTLIIEYNTQTYRLTFRTSNDEFL